MTGALLELVIPVLRVEVLWSRALPLRVPVLSKECWRLAHEITLYTVLFLTAFSGIPGLAKFSCLRTFQRFATAKRRD